MTVLKPRSKMISARLSEDEYVALQRLCVMTGARSISDLTRDAIRILLDRVNWEHSLSTRMDQFFAQMKSLDQRLEKLTTSASPESIQKEN